MTYEQLAALAKECGFTNWAPLDISTIDLKPEVRAACEDNTCGAYGKIWSCPPGCGPLEDCRAKIEARSFGILVQTVGDVEDSFDFESMMEIEQDHRDHFLKMYAALREAGVDVLALGAGGCRNCAKCTYPDEPCRFPEKMVSSMEAYGMLVLDVCKKNNLTYYYGADKMAYAGCFLL